LKVADTAGYSTEVAGTLHKDNDRITPLGGPPPFKGKSHVSNVFTVGGVRGKTIKPCFI